MFPATAPLQLVYFVLLCFEYIVCFRMWQGLAPHYDDVEACFFRWKRLRIRISNSGFSVIWQVFMLQLEAFRDFTMKILHRTKEFLRNGLRWCEKTWNNQHSNDHFVIISLSFCSMCFENGFNNFRSITDKTWWKRKAQKEDTHRTHRRLWGEKIDAQKHLRRVRRDGAFVHLLRMRLLGAPSTKAFNKKNTAQSA